MTDRGQAYTLEGVITAILIASALVLGIQAVDIQPWASAGPDQADSIRVEAEDAVDIAADEGALRDAVRCVRNDNGRYIPDSRGSSVTAEGTSLGQILNSTLDETTSYTIHLEYKNGTSGEFESQPLTAQQAPISSSVTVTRQITLFKSDPVLQYNNTQGVERCELSETWDTLGGLHNSRQLYLGDPTTDTDDLYAVVRVVIRAW